LASENILKLMAGGHRRSIGRADEVAARVRKEPRLFPQLLAGLWSEEAVVRMRAADVTEKVTRERPELLRPYKKELLGLLAETTVKEMRWHLAAIVPRLALNPKERLRAVTSLENYLQDDSSIVKTFALAGLAELSVNDRILRTRVLELLQKSARSGTAAMKARSRILLEQWEKG
jgi:hypothetical protein